MATTPVLISIEEYLDTVYKPDVDYVDGELQERELGEYEHGKIQNLIGTIFENHQESWHTDPVTEQRIRISSSRIRICDVAILHEDAPHEPVTETPPFICVEVMSPKDRIPRAKVVLADYFAMGVPNICLIDPIRRTAYTFGAQGLQQSEDLVLVVPGSPIRVDVNDLFARLDKKLAMRKRL